MRYLLCTLALVSLAGVTLAQCRGGSCGPAANRMMPGHGPTFAAVRYVSPAASAACSWHPSAKVPGRLNLWRGGENVGAYFEGKGTYHAWQVNDFGPACAPPIALPEFARPLIANYGVDRSKIGTEGERYSVNGVTVPRAKAFESVGSGKLEDDSRKLRVTVIGAPADRKRLLDDYRSNPALARYRDDVLIQEYPPDHWAIQGKGYVTTGKPTLYLQAPDGTVLHRQDEYRGPEKLIEAHRKADPSYDPSKDPDLNRPPAPKPGPPLPSIDLRKLAEQVPPLGWVILGVGGFWLLSRSKKESAK